MTTWRVLDEEHLLALSDVLLFLPSFPSEAIFQDGDHVHLFSASGLVLIRENNMQVLSFV